MRRLAGIALAVALFLAACKSPPPPAPTPTGNDPVARMERYMVDRGDKINFATPFFLAYFQRKFGANYFDQQVALVQKVAAQGPTTQVYPYVRILDPAARMSEYPTPEAAGLTDTSMTLLESLPLLALHCDTFKLPPDFLEQIRAETARGGYYTTHAVLGLQWAIEQGCITEEQARPLKEEQRAALVPKPPVDDLYVETLAMLYYGGHGDAVKKEDIDAMLKAQKPDGHLAYGEIDSDPTHTTMLALWVLLENQNPSAPRTSLIVDPGPPAR